MKKKRLIIFGGIIILLLVICAIVYNFRLTNSKVYFRLIEDKNQLNSDVTRWIDGKKQDTGVHVYMLEHRTPYELLIYYNKNEGKNLYINTTLSAELVHDELKIFINEKLASDEAFIKDKIMAHFIIKRRPTATSVYVNNKQVNIDLEIGNAPQIDKGN